MALPDAICVRVYFAAATTDPSLKKNLAPVPSSYSLIPPLDPPPELCCICVEPMDFDKDDIVKSKVRPIHR